MKNSILLLSFCLSSLASSSFGQAGRPDSSFGINGFANAAFIDDQRSWANAIAMQPDNKIIAAGARQIDAQNDYLLVRFKTNGTLDSSFGNNGTVITTFSPGSDDVINAVAVQPDGKIIAAGSSGIVRYNKDGSLDNSFAVNGKNTQVASVAYIRCMTLQKDGNILLGGDKSFFNAINQHIFFTARLQSNGYYDSTYGTNGLFEFNIHLGSSNQPNHSRGNEIVVQPDNKILLGGDIQIGNDAISSPVKPVIIRINENGTPDLSFGGGDGWNYSNVYQRGFTESIALQADGKIVAGGFTTPGSTDLLMIRYLSNGNFDSSFGNTGQVTTHVDGKSAWCYALKITDENKILSGGGSSGAYEDFFVAQYNNNGTLDSSFGSNGIGLTEPSGCRNNFGFAMLLTTAGDIMLAGRMEDPPCISTTNTNIGLLKIKGSSTPVLTIRNVTVSEGNSGKTTASFKIRLDKPSSSPVTFYYTTVDGTATAATDYTAKSGSVTLLPGKVHAKINIKITGDTQAEINERFYLKLGNAVNATIDGTGKATCIILNDDTTNSAALTTIDAMVSRTATITITPNPVQNILSIKGLGSATTLTIIDAAGAIKSKATAANDTYNWNIQQLSAGIYFLVIEENGKHIATSKFIKQ